MSDILPATAILEIEMEEPKPIQVAQIYDQEQNPINGSVYSEDGIAPTLRTPTGGLSEPKIAVSCALRGRNPENPSDRTAGINTEQRLEIGSDVANCITTVQKGSMVIEPAILTPIRTEKAKELRRQGIETFANRELVPRTDGCSGTITTVQKDNLLQEPSILGYTRDDKGGVQNYHEREVAGTIHTSSGSGGNTDQYVKEPCGCYDNQFGEFFRPPLKGVSRTVKTDGHNAVLLKYRIRKLTPTECLRLMDCEDEDIQKMLNAQVPQVLKSGKVKYKPLPKTAAYKLAGNSICVAPLYYIFKAMFVDEPPRPKPIQKSLFDI